MGVICRGAGPYRLAILAFAAVNLAIALAVGDYQTLHGDEWTYVRRIVQDGLIGGILHPPNAKYALPVPLTVYWAFLNFFGLGSYLPFRLLTVALLATNGLLLFELARRHAGAVVACTLACLTVLLGSAGVVVAISLRSPSLMALAAGLGALLALERRTRRGDVAALALLCLSVACHPLGLAFIAGAAIVLAGRRWRSAWREAWIVVPPAALAFALVQLTSPPPGVQASLSDRVHNAVHFLPDTFVATVAGASGLFEPVWERSQDFHTPLAAVVAALLLLAVALAFALRSDRRLAILAAATVALALFAGPLLAPGAQRAPAVERYVYPNTVALLLVLAVSLGGLTGGRRLRTPALAAGAAAFAFAVSANGLALKRASVELSANADYVRAELAAFDLADGGLRERSLYPDSYRQVLGRHRLYLSPGLYRKVKADFGSPAWSPGELRARPEAVQADADRTLALIIGLRPVAGGGPARLETPSAPRPCRRRAAGASRPGLARVPERVPLLVDAPSASVELWLGRFAPPSYPLGRIAPGRPVILRIPATAGGASWRLGWRPASAPLRVCAGAG